MNILALTSAYPQPDDNGTVVTPTVKYFCEKWAEAGHRVVVVHSSSAFPSMFYLIPKSIREKASSKMGFSFPTYESKKTLIRTENGVIVYRFPLTKIVPHAKFSMYCIQNQIKKIEKSLEEIGFIPDVIISHWVNPQIQLILPLKKKYGAISSLVFHTDCSSKNIQRFDLINSAKQLDAIGCRNKTEAENVRNTLNLDHEPFICYSGIPDKEADGFMESLNDGELFSSKNKREFLYVGRLVEYKNVDTIIRALALTYPDGKYHLHIVGEGAEFNNLKELCTKVSSEESVIFHGQMQRGDVFDLMKKCSCFIMVSDNETFGMVYLEAMISGCITVASEKGGVDGVIIDGVNGYLSKQKDVNALVEKLRIIDNLSDDECALMRRKAVETAYRYRDTSVANRYLEDVIKWKNEKSG